MPLSDCLTGTLTPYVPSPDHPWDKSRVQHVYRRLGFGASLDEINAALALSPSQWIDQLVDEALEQPVMEAPAWADWSFVDFNQDFEQIYITYYEWRDNWLYEMMNKGLRERLALFWSNHFVTEFEAYSFPPAAYSYLLILQQHALGNFRDFVQEMGKSAAMLVYLSGAYSTRVEPNENYARELFELFTLGQDIGYTQEDIIETARALTGWTLDSFGAYPSNEVYFIEPYWDPESKTIFGQTGNWGYDDVHEILFTQRKSEIATHICTKLYREFVNPQVDTQIVEGLAETFIAANFEIAPVLRQLFKSEHFFDPEIVGTQIKNPITTELGFLRDINFPLDNLPDFLAWGADFLGQAIFSPVDVAGWPGHRTWINSDRLTGRWRILDYLVYYTLENEAEVLREFAKQLTENSNDPAYITQTFVEYFTSRGAWNPDVYQRLTDVFKSEVPQNYFDSGFWNLDWESAPWQVALLLFQIFRLPEFQLH